MSVFDEPRFILCSAFCLIIPDPSFGQDRDPNAIREEDLRELWDQKIAVTHWLPSPSTIAKQMLENYEFVAVGEFLDFPAEAADDAAFLEPRDVIVRFNPHTVYKGDTAPGSMVDVQLNSDMLSFPREPAVSRYTKRRQVRLEQARQLKELDQQLTRLAEDLENKRIAQQTFRDEQTALLARREELIARSLATGTRRVAVIDGESFYDLGGVIRPDTRYLVGLNRTGENIPTYLLEEFATSTSNIVWGETFDEVVPVLSDPAR